MKKKETFVTLLRIKKNRHFSVRHNKLNEIETSNATVNYWPKPAIATVFLKQDKVLLIQRGKNPNKGQWTLPGGHLEKGENIIECARRELSEEVSFPKIHLFEQDFWKNMIQFSTPFTVINALQYTDGTSTKEYPEQQKEVSFHFVILEVCATIDPVYEHKVNHLLETVLPATDAMGAQWVTISDLETSSEWKEKAIARTTLLQVIKQAHHLVQHNLLSFHKTDPKYE